MNIKGGYGVPIWFAVNGLKQDAVMFLQLVFLWAQMSHRNPDDPFLTYRTTAGCLEFLTYKTFQATIKECAVAFGQQRSLIKVHQQPIIIECYSFWPTQRCLPVRISLLVESYLQRKGQRGRQYVDFNPMIIIGFSRVAMIKSNAGVMTVRMGVYSTMMVHEDHSGIHYISSMPPCVHSMTTGVELYTVLNQRSSSLVDHLDDEAVTILF